MTIPFNLEGALLRKEDLHAMIVDEGSASIVTPSTSRTGCTASLKSGSNVTSMPPFKIIATYPLVMIRSIMNLWGTFIVSAACSSNR